MNVQTLAERRMMRRLLAFNAAPPRTVERYQAAVLLAESARLLRRLEQRMGGGMTPA